MPRNLTLTDALKMARHFVAAYEGAAEAARQFQERFHTNEELRVQMEADLKAAAGGEVMYEASRRFLAEHGEEPAQ